MRGLGLYLGLGLGNTQGGGIVTSIKWLATFVLNLISTVGPNIVSSGTSPTTAEVFDETLGLVIETVPDGVPFSRGERLATTAADGATPIENNLPLVVGDYDTLGDFAGTFSVINASTTSDVWSGNQPSRTIDSSNVGKSFVLTINLSDVSGLPQLKIPGTATTQNPVNGDNLYSGVVLSGGQNFLRLLTGASSTINSWSLLIDEPVFYNDTAPSSGISLHPTKQLTENGVTSTVFMLYDYRQDSEAISIGDRRYLVGTTFNFSLTATVGGTTHSAPPTIVQGDVGSTVAEDSGTVVWAVGYYSGIATETVNYLPHV